LATNSARIYNHALSDTAPPGDWAFGFTVTTEKVWDGFVLMVLLEDCQGQSKLLEVPHTGAQKDRFTAALHSRNLHFRMYGQPELHHYCNKCMRVFKDGTKVWVVVIDGVTVGCPCCAVHNCKIPLQNNQHRFCPNDAAQNLICVIVGCNSPVTPDHHTCSGPSHQEAEHIHCEQGQARFQLKECLQHAKVVHPNDAVAEDVDTSELIDADQETGEFDVGAQAGGKKEHIWGQFGQR
jgi:hypothetical protein